MAIFQDGVLRSLFKFVQGAAHIWDTHEIGLARQERALQVFPMEPYLLSLFYNFEYFKPLNIYHFLVYITGSRSYILNIIYYNFDISKLQGNIYRELCESVFYREKKYFKWTFNFILF